MSLSFPFRRSQRSWLPIYNRSKSHFGKIKGEISQWSVVCFNASPNQSDCHLNVEGPWVLLFILVPVQNWLFPFHIQQPYLVAHDELLMHMNSFHICWVNWHVGPTVASIKGVYVPLLYCRVQCSAIYFAAFLACVQPRLKYAMMEHVHAFFFH